MTPQRPRLDGAEGQSQQLATVAAEITGDCSGPGRENVRHRVWLHRDGTVSLPDHHYDSDAEQVARALGDGEINFCQYWKRFNGTSGRVGKHTTGTPHRTLPGWEITYESFWTPQSQWTALAGILNSIAFAPINPGWALSYAQEYLEKCGQLPNKPSDHMSNLATPWARQQGGYRRRHTVTSKELGELLDAGVPLENASLFAVLDIDPKTAQRAIQLLKSWGHPADLFIRLCYALPPAAAVSVLESLKTERGGRLPSILSDLQGALREHPAWTEGDIRSYLLGDYS